MLLTALFFVTSRAKADDYSFKMGMGLVEGSPTGQIKTFSLRKEEHVIHALHLAKEAGVWVDNVSDDRKSAVFCKYQLGVKAGPETGMYAKAFLGGSIQSSTDSQLGSNLQFAEDIGFGIRDRYGFVELNYSHHSSAGLSKPNKGRDFFSFLVGIRL